MDLNLFATQIVQNGTKSSNNALFGNGALGGQGLGSLNVDFLNALLSNVAAEKSEESAQLHLDKKEVANTNSIKQEKADLALLQLALLGQDPDVNLDEKLAELRIERIAQNPENRIEQLSKLIDHLTSGLPTQADAGASIEDLVARLNQRLEKLTAGLDAFRTGDFGEDGAPFKLLIATGLNPAQLTTITNRIEEVETKLGRPLTVEDLIVGVGNIIPVVGDDDQASITQNALSLILKPQTTEEEIQLEYVTKNEELAYQNKKSLNENLKIEEQVAELTIASLTARLNALESTTGNVDQRKNIQDKIDSILGVLSAMKSGTTELELGATDSASQELDINGGLGLPTQMTNSEFNALFGRTKGQFAVAQSISNGTPNSNMGSMANASGQALATPPAPTLGAMSFPAAWSDASISHSALSDALGFDIQTGTPFSTTMQAVHAATQNAQAGQTHSATQMVSAHITKAANNGDTRQITLRLDPPELGRVEVRLEFGAEKSVKAHLFVEKPETLLMLQRDASALEKALQDAGLETDSGSLNYEMASDESGFNNGKDGNGQGNGTGANAAAGDAIDEDGMILETTMNWDVDPETGHVHYNIIA